jgi:colanic acid/amylovoran biosynthesis glycosyltransferase
MLIAGFSEMVDRITQYNNGTASHSDHGVLNHRQHTSDASTRVSMPVRIGYLISVFPALTHIIFWRQITLLREMGVELVLLSTRRPSPGSCPHEFAAQAEAETYYAYPPPLLSCSMTLASRPLGVFRALRYLANLRESPIKDRVKRLGLLFCAANLLHHIQKHDIRHIHAHSAAEGAHLVALCRLLGGPTYSLTLHGDLPVYGTDHRSKMADASFVMTDGPHLKKQVESEIGIPAERVISNFLGIDTEKWHDAGLHAHEPGRLHVVTVARLNYTKGIQHALAAVRSVLDRGFDLRYSVAGEGPYRPEIEAEIRRLGLSDRVTLLGMLSEAQIIRLNQEADVFVLPSIGLGEAFPSAVIEAMASGLPVISSIIGATPEMITHGVEGFLVEPGDEAGLTAALVRLAENPDERRRMGEAGQSRAGTAFDRKNSASRFLQAITERTSAGRS